MEYNDVMVEISDFLEEKDPKSIRGTLAALYQYKRRHSGDELRVRAVDVVIKYNERIAKTERFNIFAKQKALLIGKKVPNLTKDELLEFKSDFDRLEEQQRVNESTRNNRSSQ